jgi:hypothetical protein
MRVSDAPRDVQKVAPNTCGLSLPEFALLDATHRDMGRDRDGIISLARATFISWYLAGAQYGLTMDSPIERNALREADPQLLRERNAAI